jgi:hypothetical protein
LGKTLVAIAVEQAGRALGLKGAKTRFCHAAAV